MRKIVHENTRHGIQFHVFNHTHLGQVTHIIVLIAELQRNKTIEATCFILKGTQLVHVVDAVGIRFNVTVQHGGIAVHAQLVGRAVNIEPTFAIYFVFANLFTHGRGKNFGAATGERLQAGIAEFAHTFFAGEFGFAEHIIEFHGGEAFQM